MSGRWGPGAASPNRWYWFLDGTGNFNLKTVVGKYVPAGGNVHDLPEFA
jgi:hypothetical protein